MTDFFNRSLKFIDHHRGMIVAMVLAVICAAWMIGCEATTGSLIDDTRQVTAPQIEREVIVLQGDIDRRAAAIEQMIAGYNADVEQLNAQIEAASSDIQDQLERRKQIIETLGALGASIAQGTVNPAAAISGVITLSSLFGVAGVGYDNWRKNKVINKLKAPPDAAPAV